MLVEVWSYQLSVLHVWVVIQQNMALFMMLWNEMLGLIILLFVVIGVVVVCCG